MDKEQNREQASSNQQQPKKINVVRYGHCTDAEIEAYNKEEHRKFAEQLLDDAQLPGVYRKMQLPYLTKHKDWAGAFEGLCALLTGPFQATDPGALVILTGLRGTGKSAMAAQALCFCANRGRSIYWTSLESLLRACRDWKEPDLHDTFFLPRVLVIDEVAKYSGGGWEERQLFWILNDRYENQRHTICTCSCTKADLVSLLPPSIMDRIKDKHSGILYLDWPSFREPAK